MARQTRSDCTVGTFEKKNGLPEGTLRHKDGRKMRSDKTIGDIRREGEKKAKSGKALTAQSPSGSPRRPRYIGEADEYRKPPANCRGLD